MKRAYNVLQVIKAIVDDGEFFELKAKFAAQPGDRFWPPRRSPRRFCRESADVLAGSWTWTLRIRRRVYPLL